MWSRVPNTCVITGNLSLYGRESSASPFVEISNTVNPNNFIFTHLGANLPINKDWEYFFTYKVDCGTGIIDEYSDTIAIDIIPPDQSFIDSVSVEPGTNNIQIGWTSNKSPDFGSYSLYNYNRADPRVIENYIDTFYIDKNSGNPSTTKLKYEITSLDSCGNRNPLNGNIHQTILLTSKTDTCERTCDLSWSAYEGWSQIRSYYIYRWNAPDQILIDSVPSNITSYKVSNLLRLIPYSYFVRAFKLDNRIISSSSNSTNSIPFYRIEPSGQYLTNVSRENSNIEISIEQKSSENKAYTILQKLVDNKYTEIHRFNNSENLYIDKQASTKDKNLYRVIAVGLCENVFDTSNISGNIVLTLSPNDPNLAISWNPYSTWNKGVKEYIINRASGTNESNAINYMALTTSNDTGIIDLLDKNTAVCYYIEAYENTSIISSKSNIECLSFSGNIYWPNAISPNGSNKQFLFYGIGIDNNKTAITIFNKWGQIVFETNSLQQAWSGTNNESEPLQSDIYFFKAQVSQNDKISEKTGNITIIR